MKFINYVRAILFRVIHSSYCSRVYHAIIRHRFDCADMIIVDSMQKLICPERCNVTGALCHYMYYIRLGKKDRILKGTYHIGPHALARLIVDRPVQTVCIHPECNIADDGLGDKPYAMLTVVLQNLQRRIYDRLESFLC